MAWLLTRPPHNDNGKNMQSALLTIRDAPVVNKAPFFPVVIEHFPRIVGHRFPCSSCRSSKQRCNSPCCLFTGQSRHFDFTAVILILEIKGQAPHLRKVLHPELPAAAR